MSVLFSKFKLRSIEFRNRVFVSPMCQYSSHEGVPTDWHLVHLGSRAVGGAALVIQEATAVTPGGRISPMDAGLWSDAQAEAYRRITRFITDQGAIAGIQLAHAGRKASTAEPWNGGGAVSERNGGWVPVAPSDLAFSARSLKPRELSVVEIANVREAFEESARRALTAGFQVLEIHMAHGYLLHEFLSPLSNKRKDEYGGSFENRIRFPQEVARSLRKIWPAEWPVFVRISATDWVEGGWDLPQSIRFARELKRSGIDLVDCSSGGLVPDASIPDHPGYQVPFSSAIRKEAGIATGAVGLITEPQQAEEILSRGEADALLLARAMLRDPYWPVHAARSLGASAFWPKQYGRAHLVHDK